MHKDPRQKHFLRIKGKIRGIYVVKILHICRIIFIFYAFSGRENCSRSAQAMLRGPHHLMLIAVQPSVIIKYRQVQN